MYKLMDGIAMGFPLKLILANIFIVEPNSFMTEAPIIWKPVYWFVQQFIFISLGKWNYLKKLLMFQEGSFSTREIKKILWKISYISKNGPL